MERRKTNAYCDCAKLSVLNGRKPRYSNTNESGNMYITEANADEACIHCGHQVYWALENPDTGKKLTGRERKSQEGRL